MAVVLDTHAAIWYLSRSEQLSAAALKKIEASVQAGESVFLSAISLVELIYLSEKGRLPAGALATLVNALQAADASMVVVPLDSAVAGAVGRISRSAVPDMPDRIIAATAAHLGLPLITRDRQIQAAGINTVW
jgi:PIN domain nuclease of toxin-antitoxin system